MDEDVSEMPTSITHNATEYISPIIQNLIQQESIRYTFLPSHFFKTQNNIVQQKKLKKILSFIESPEFFGQFNNEQHYLRTLELLFSSTEETEHRKIFFQRLVLPYLPTYNHFLEIGVGNGVVTKIICEKFKKATLIDLNKKALNCLSENDFTHQIKIKKIFSSILDVKLNKDTFDFASAAHLLYYIPHHSWLSVIRKIYQAIKPGGFLVLVLSGGLDKFKMGSYFQGTPVSLDELVVGCERNFNTKIGVFDIKELSSTIELESALHIAGLYLNDANAVATRFQLINYLKRNHKTENDDFNFHFIQRFILLQKNQ